MRVALIADIHGNLQAFEAVLAEIAAESVDRIVCLGDVASFGPQPREVIARLRTLGCPVVMGNADADVLAPPAIEEMEGDRRRLGEMDAWTHDLLSEDERAYLQGFAPTIPVDLGGGKTLLCYHGSPRSFNDRILPETPHETLDEWFGDAPALLYAGGHTHLQMLRRHHTALVINPGSIGLAYDTHPPMPSARNPAWGEYALVEVAGDRVRVELRRTPFNTTAMIAAARAAGMPHADWWASDWDAPSEE